MQNIKVSVIIPVYNAELFLRTCLKSILNQTFKEFEILCIDDGSTDESLNILNEYALIDSRIKVIHQENKGTAAARNTGIERAKGKYICFVDADDFIHPNQLFRTYNLAEESKADIVMFGGRAIPAVSWIDQKLNVENGVYENPFQVVLSVTGARPFIWNKLFRTTLFRDNDLRFDTTLSLGEDQAFLFDAFPLAKVVVASEEKFYGYRQNAGSAMACWNKNMDDKMIQHFKIVNHIVEHWNKCGYNLKYGTELAEWIITFLYQDLMNCHFDFRRSAYKELLNIITALTDITKFPQEIQNKVIYMQHVMDWDLTPSVSIIMPVYNAEEYLEETLSGLTRQTFPFFEMILVDDGSKDCSLEILKDFAAKDSRVIIREQNHLFAGAARNTGIQLARGKYMLFLDSDDFFAPDMIKKSYDKAETTGADICVFEADSFDNVTKTKSAMNWTMKKALCPQEEECFSIKSNPKYIYAFTTAAPWNKFFRVDFIRRYGLLFQTTRSANDLAFIFTALALASKIALVDGILLTYRVNNKKSLQGSQDKKPDAFYDAMKELKERLEKFGVYDIAKQAFLNFSLDYCFYNLRTLKEDKSYDCIFELIKNTIIPTFAIDKKPDEYFYAYQANRIIEKKHDLDILSSTEFARKWKGFLSLRNPINEEECSTIAKERVSNPKISIIMPLLNSMVYLEECLVSVLQQTLSDIEIICVDAGSTDGTIEFIEKYAQYDKRIMLLHSDCKSYGHQVNLGIQHANGEYMAIVESDDYILPNMYEVLYGIAQRLQVDFVKCDFSRFYGDKSHRTFAPAKVLNDNKRYNRVGNPQEDPDWFKAYVLITPAIYSVSFIKENNILLHETLGASYQDNGFWFQVLMHAERVWFHPESFYMLRRDNPNSSVKSKSKVYAMCVEYDFIYNLFANDKNLLKKYAPVCAKLRLDNYNFTLERISDEYKLDFLIKYSDDFREILKKKELHGELFSDTQWERLMNIIENPINYYFEHVYFNEGTIKKRAESKNCSRDFEKEFYAMQNSLSFRIGRTITWGPRKARGIYRCFRQHGAFYTMKRTIEHVGIDMGTGDFNKK